eukprot:15346724-Ditylum_brightwellii.AAC.1
MDYDIYQGDRTCNRARQLWKAKRDRCQTRQDSHTKHQQYLEEKIWGHNNNKKGIKITDEIQCIKKGEKQKRLYNNFARLQNKQDTSTLSFINVPDNEAFWTATLILMTLILSNNSIFSICVPHRRISSKEDVERHLQTHFVSHFSQAHGIPFTTSPIINTFGYDLNTQFATAFMSGHVNVSNYPDIPQEMQQLLQELLPKPTDSPQISLHITPEQEYT